MSFSRQTYILIATLLFPLTVLAQGPRGNSNSNSNGPEGPAIEQKAYAWRPLFPTGQQEMTQMDTLEYNFFQQAIPSAISYAYACTGNLGAEGKNMLAMEQRPISQFFLQDAQYHWTPTYDKLRFYNTRIPMTLVTYNTGGSRDNSQDRLTVVFSGNINKKAQVGANLDYLYSKGSYSNQSTKGLTWGLDGSYIGDKYEVQGAWAHYNLLNKESGGITDDLYITDPAELQGGVSSINPKSIPTHLSNAHTRIVGGELFLNNRYKLGFWREIKDEETDSAVGKEFVPVTAFFWNLNYKNAKHIFIDNNSLETGRFFEHTYLNPSITDDKTNYSLLSNCVGISLLEGFNKYAKFGLSAFIEYEIRRYTQTTDTIDRVMPDQVGLSPFPEGIQSILARKTQNLAWVGAQISKLQGPILQYEAICELGLVGDAVGELKVKGNVGARIPLFGDTASISGYGHFYNTSAPYLLNNYLSNHFIWQNDFSKERRLRLGGILNLPWTKTSVNVGTETLQNYIYFGPNALPLQCSDAVQVFSATLDQKLNVGILHWDNKVTYQTSSNQEVMPLPKLAIYSNLYILCNIATLHLQLGIDCDYYTKYYAPGYQPATATFYNQREKEIGNFPFMNAYANMKLGRVRFYVMMTHVNQGIIGKNNYFSSPSYPLNPRRFQLGLSVDFHD